MKIKAFIGPVSCGKTSIGLVHNLEQSYLSGKYCLVIKKSFDTRYDSLGKLITNKKVLTNDHIIIHQKERLDIMHFNDLLESLDEIIYSNIEKYGTNNLSIFIDEIQFFNDLKQFVHICIKKELQVFMTGITIDYLGNYFNNVLETLALIGFNNISNFYGICNECKCKKANFSMRLNFDYEKYFNDKLNIQEKNNSTNISNINNINSNSNNNINKIEIGGIDKFVPVCYKHFPPNKYIL